MHRLIQAVGSGPVDLFASSGGAVNALALVAKHPEDVRILVAHEPPLAAILPDQEHALAAARAVHETYQRSGWGAGIAHFIAVTSYQGPFTAEIAGQPAPDPATFGMPTEDDGSRTDVMLGQNLITFTHYQPDFDALRAASTRIILAAGAELEGQMASRGAFAIAERLGTEPAIFPSNHGGFLAANTAIPATRTHSPGSCVRFSPRAFDQSVKLLVAGALITSNLSPPPCFIGGAHRKAGASRGHGWVRSICRITDSSMASPPGPATSWADRGVPAVE
jgi:pimeloyl-ACP methyl ester carboxylesterase